MSLPRSARTAAYLVVPMVALVLVATLVLGRHGAGQPGSAPVAGPTATTLAGLPGSGTALTQGERLVGDLDGDGTQDVVRLAPGGLLRVDLAGAGTPVETHVGRPAHLLGLADIGGPGRAVVVQFGQGGRRATRVVQLSEDRLVTVRTSDGAWLGSDRFQTVWIGPGHRLFVAALGTPGAGRTAVYPHVWERGPDGALTAGTVAGDYCWARGRAQPPRRCPPGVSYGPQVGSHADLPVLFPAATTGAIGVGESFRLDRAGHPPGRISLERRAVVVEVGGRTHRAPVATGWAPALFRQLVDTGPGDGAGLLVSQEGGDSDTWTLDVWRNGELVRAEPASGVPFGGGFTADGRHAYTSWVTPDGRLYTRVGLDRPHHFRLWHWTLDGTRLTAGDLGEVCLDLQADPEKYGVC